MHHAEDGLLKITLDEKGNKVSPMLPGEIKNYLIDIDGTVCDDVPNEEPERMVTAIHYPDALEIVNKWYDEGHIITYFTSRTLEHKKITEEWLDKMDSNIMGYYMKNQEEETIIGLIII